MASGIVVETLPGDLLVLGGAVAALAYGVKLLSSNRSSRVDGWLGARLALSGAGVLLAFVLHRLPINAPEGSAMDLILLLMVCAGAGVLALDLPIVLSSPGSPSQRIQNRWLRWAPILPAILVAGWVLVGWPGAQPGGLGADPFTPAWTEWQAWADAHDRVEDATIFLTIGTVLLLPLVLIGILAGRRASEQDPRRQAMISGMLRDALTPLVAWLALAVLVVGYAFIFPNAGRPHAVLSEFVLGGATLFSLLLWVPVLWARRLSGELGELSHPRPGDAGVTAPGIR